MSIEITNFDGDIESVNEMATQAWRFEYGKSAYPNLYRKELLQYYLAATPPQHHTAAYDGKKLVGFLANLARTYRLHGKIRNGAVSCLLFTHKDYMRQGLATQVIEKAIEINKRDGYIDFSLNYLDRGHKSTYLIEKFSKTYTIHPVKEIYAISRIIDLPTMKKNERLHWYEAMALKALWLHGIPRQCRVSGQVRPYRSEDAQSCVNLLNDYQNHVPFARVWEVDELDRQFNYPPVSRSLVYEDGAEIKAVINYTLVEHMGPASANYAWLNHLHYGHLGKNERQHFLASFLSDAASQGCASVLEWNKNYYDKTALWRCRFIPYPRILRLVSWIFNPEISMANLDAFYEQHI